LKSGIAAPIIPFYASTQRLAVAHAIERGKKVEKNNPGEGLIQIIHALANLTKQLHRLR
jgi:hypothetical protein